MRNESEALKAEIARLTKTIQLREATVSESARESISQKEEIAKLKNLLNVAEAEAAANREMEVEASSELKEKVAVGNDEIARLWTELKSKS